MDVEAEIRDLKRRVSEIEGSGGFLIEQVRGVHKDLLTFRASTEQFQASTEQFQARMEQFQARMEQFQVKTGQRFDKVEGRLDRVERGLGALRKDLPGIVGDAMRAVLRQSQRKSRKTPE